MNMNQIDTIFNNGPALFEQLSHPIVLDYLNIISEYETKSHFHVLHYWNRKWEYPFIMKVADLFELKGKVLDAGAGKSLMPFIFEKTNRFIEALDIDDGSFYPKNSLKLWYEDMNKILGTNINFVNDDILNTKYGDESFDFIYSMSVLEHLKEPFVGLLELWRILKPGGVIVLTLDLSLDDTRGMFHKEFKQIGDFLSSKGRPLLPENYNLSQGIITTDWFKINEPQSLPWHIDQISKKTIMKKFLTGRWNKLIKSSYCFDSLAVIGFAYKKPEL